MSATFSATSTFTAADVENVFRRFRGDILMIADSSGAISRDEAEEYAHDAEYLAKRGYLAKVDLTLLSNNTEIRAAVYRVNESSGDITSARPGGVLWPRVSNSRLRVIISYTSAYTDEARERSRPQLIVNWTPSGEDTSHASLTKTASRAYASNGFGLEREDLS